MSNLFLVLKKTGDLGPVINLKPFMNKFVVKGYFWKLSVFLVNLSTATII